jgi:hypothetical protein
MAGVERIGSGKGKKIKPQYINKHNPKKVELIIKGEHQCQWCNRIFSTEKTLFAHMCEQRRRFQQKDTIYCRYGLEAFLAISKTLRKGDNLKEEDFRKSDFYLACVRWGHFVIDVHCLKPTQYLNWLLERNIQIDKWNKDEIYSCWIQEIVFLENEWDALDRSITTMSEWAEENNKNYNDYFREAGGARILWDVSRALISGWVVYCSESGKKWLEQLEQRDLEIVWGVINPSRWAVRFEKMNEEKNEITKTCLEAGL